jgi:hypothetical protein
VTLRVAVWSGPRNISTALMRSWENRPDTVVVDEPFYAAYLHRTGLAHPGRDEVLAAQPTEPERVVAALLAEESAPVQYSKQMTHHLDPDADRAWLRRFHHVLLIRDPREVVASYVRSRESCEADDLGVLQQVALHRELSGHANVPVVDAADFLRDPRAHLEWLCDWLGLDFDERMLSWPAGPRDSDGVWAPHWYDAVLASTGFAAYRPRDLALGEHDAAVAERCRPAYEWLRERALRL